MQPYFVPYIGYWQLLNVVDKYVIYDDVNFIKGGWINRNRIIVGDRVNYFNIPMHGASSNKLINEIGVDNTPTIIAKNLRVLISAYSKAPYFDEVYPLLEKILNCGLSTLSSYIINSIRIISNYLDIQTELIISSELKKDNDLKGQSKVLEICDLLKATEYINAIGGKSLYSFTDFNKRGICLKFLKTADDISYLQFTGEFIPNLSIIDVMMFNSKADIKKMLNQYTLISDIN